MKPYWINKNLLTRCALVVVIFAAVWLALAARSPTVESVAHADATVVRILGAAHPPGLSPYILTIHEGDSVSFKNEASPKGVHSVVGEGGSFTSPSLQPGQQWTTTFAYQGSYIYHDPTAYDQVVGVIIVVPPSIALQPTPAPGSIATVAALAKASRAQGQHASSSPGGFPLWLLAVLAIGAMGVGGLAFVIFRRR